MGKKSGNASEGFSPKEEIFEPNNRFDNSELMQSYTEEQDTKVESLENNLDYVEQSLKDNLSEVKKDACEKYISDLKFYIRNKLTETNLTVRLERDKASELNNLNKRLEKKLKAMEEKVHVLEKALDASFDELENNGGLKYPELKTEISSLESEIAKKDEIISNLKDENKTINHKMDIYEIEKAENDIERMNLESQLRESSEEVMNLESQLREYSEEVESKQTETEDKSGHRELESATKDTSNDAMMELRSKLDEYAKILVVQEEDIKTKARQINLMSKKIKQWGLEDKLNDEPKEFTPKRKAPKIFKQEPKTPNTEKKIKSPKIISEEEEIDEEDDTSLNASTAEFYEDTDPKHPTSSFNLRRKGRNHKGRKKLRPMGPLAEYVSESVGDIIVNKGDTTQSGDVYRYFAIRKKPVLRKHFFERKIVA